MDRYYSILLLSLILLDPNENKITGILPQNPSNNSGQFEPSSPPRSGTRPAPDTPKTALIKHVSRNLEEQAQHLQRERNMNDEVMGELEQLKHKLEVREAKEEQIMEEVKS